MPPIEDLKQVMEWLSPTVPQSATTRAERIDSVIKLYRESRLNPQLWQPVETAD